jgi:predicted glycogen debranching enzyme
VAALAPPVRRTVLLGALIEWAAYGARRYPLSTHEYADGTVDPRGYVHQAAFALDGMLPVWWYALADAVLEKRVWMAHEANTTYIRYRLLRGTSAADLEIMPLVTYRDFHTLRSGAGWQPAAAAEGAAVVIRASPDAAPLRILLERGAFDAGGVWYWNFRHREEAARGLDDRSDLYAPGVFRVRLAVGEEVALVASCDPQPAAPAERALQAAQDRQADLLRRAGAEQDDPLIRQLTLAADQFLVRRDAGGTTGRTVIAGYHWFNDWGRDTMIALPGLALATGRLEVSEEILRRYARLIRDGLLPNNFSDRPDAGPGYNTADASLWYVLAVLAHYRAAGSGRLIEDLLPAIRDILDRYAGGTRFGIGMDPADGLLRAGEEGLPVTWMDARVGDRGITARAGKPVELNALWCNALAAAAELLAAGSDRHAASYAARAARARASFGARFLHPRGRRLADVVDGPDGDDLAARPNQIFAVSLPFPLLERDDATAVVEAVGRMLLTTYGLRSLGPDDAAYQGQYLGDVRRRDGAYHQGTAWAWLMGAYAEAHVRVHGDRETGLALLRPFGHHLADAGLGTISEIFDGDPPHQPRGCIAQAWSVAEVLRVWRALAGGGVRAPERCDAERRAR